MPKGSFIESIAGRLDFFRRDVPPLNRRKREGVPVRLLLSLLPEIVKPVQTRRGSNEPGGAVLIRQSGPQDHLPRRLLDVGGLIDDERRKAYAPQAVLVIRAPESDQAAVSELDREVRLVPFDDELLGGHRLQLTPCDLLRHPVVRGDVPAQASGLLHRPADQPSDAEIGLTETTT